MNGDRSDDRLTHRLAALADRIDDALDRLLSRMALKGDICNEIGRRRLQPELVGEAHMRLHDLGDAVVIRDIDDLLLIELERLHRSNRALAVNRSAPFI